MPGLAVGICLDESSSMNERGAAEQAVEGFNSYMEDLRRQEGPIYVAVATFHGHSAYVTQSGDVSDIVDLVYGSNYNPRGKTPMLDAIGETIHRLDGRLHDYPGHGALVVVHSDGEENSSQSWNWERVHDLVTRKEADGWKFLFVGVGQADGTVDYQASRIGMSPGSTMSVSRAATMASYEGVSRATVEMQANPGMTAAEFAAAAARGMKS